MIQRSHNSEAVANNGNNRLSFDASTLELIILKRRGYSYRTIGQRLSVTRTTIMNRLRAVIAEYGEDILASKNPFLTVKEAAIVLQVDSGVIARLCSKGAVRARKTPSGRYLLRRAVVKKLKQHPAITGTIVCLECGQAFTYTKRHTGTLVTCSAECARKRRRHQLEHCMNQPLQDSSLSTWHRLLKQKLAEHSQPENETWLTIDEALQESSLLSRMQLWWLHRRRLIQTRRHKTRKGRTGEPVVLFPLSVVQLADSTYQDYVQLSR